MLNIDTMPHPQERRWMHRSSMFNIGVLHTLKPWGSCMLSYFFTVDIGDDVNPHFDIRPDAPMVGPFATLAEAHEAAGVYSRRHRCWTAVVSARPRTAPRPRRKRQ